MYQSEYEFWEVFCLLLCSDDIKIALEVYAPCHQDLVDLDEKSLQQLGLCLWCAGVKALALDTRGRCYRTQNGAQEETIVHDGQGSVRGL